MIVVFFLFILSFKATYALTQEEIINRCVKRMDVIQRMHVTDEDLEKNCKGFLKNVIKNLHKEKDLEKILLLSKKFERGARSFEWIAKFEKYYKKKQTPKPIKEEISRKKVKTLKKESLSKKVHLKKDGKRPAALLAKK